MKSIISLIASAILTLNSSQAQWIRSNSIPSTRIVALAHKGNIMLAATFTDTLYYSENGGISWAPKIVSNAPINITALFFYGDSIFVGTHNNGIFVSRNNGDSWVNTGIGLLSVSGFALKDGQLYVSTLGTGVAVYNNNTTSWTIMNDSLPDYSANVFGIVSTSSSLLNAAGANGTFYRYDFAGSQWLEEFYYDILRPGLSISGLIFDSNVLFAVNGNRIIRSDNDGVDWADDKLDTYDGADRRIYAGSADYFTLTNLVPQGTWLQKRNKQMPGGASWADEEEFISTGYCYDILEHNTILFLATNNGLYIKSAITGVEDAPANNPATVIYPNPSHGGNLYIKSRKEIRNLEFYNAAGQKVDQVAVNNTQDILQFQLAPGIYFIYITYLDGSKSVKKFISE